MSDLAQKIRERLGGLPGAEPVAPVAMARAVIAVLAEHEHEFLDTYIRTTNVSKAEYVRCRTCGNVNRHGEVWCPTVRAIAAALGVREDPEGN